MTPDLASYSKIIVAFSGGKDSLACLLELLELGVEPGRIELWHHDVDGREGSSLMDWPCTRSYCAKIAEAFGVEICFSWKEGGFERELLRLDHPTAPTRFQTLDSGNRVVGGRGKHGTRRRFPQVSGDLRVRWCSPYLKIDPCAAAIRNQPRFNNAKTLVVTGERAAESSNRAKYNPFAPDRADRRHGKSARHVDHWMPIHAWDTAQVWSLIEKYRVNPHPAYRLGWGRVSCAACIFGSPNQWASLRAVNPEQFERVAQLEDDLSREHSARTNALVFKDGSTTPRFTIQRARSVRELADLGTPHAFSEADRIAATSTTFREPAILDKWAIPAGAHGEATGPT